MTLDRVNPRFVLFLVVAGLVAAVLWAARGSLAPFVLGLVLAYLLAPLVTRVEGLLPDRLKARHRARPVAILLVYFSAFAVVSVAAAAVIPPVVRQAQDLLGQAPELADASITRITRLVDEYYASAPDHIRDIIDEVLSSDAAERLTSGVVDGARRGLMNAAGALTNTVEWLLAFVIVPIWLVYVLNDTKGAIRFTVGLVPEAIRADVESLRVICDRVLNGYIRGQLVVALLLGLMVTIALTLLHVPYALLLGFTAGALGIIPFIGSILGAVPAVAVAASQSLKLAVLVVLAFVIVQQIDNILISPRVQGRSVALNPAVIMVVLVIGQTLFGVIGLLAAVPVTAILRDVVHYLYVRLGDPRPSPMAALTLVGYGEAATPLIRETAGTGANHPDPESDAA